MSGNEVARRDSGVPGALAELGVRMMEQDGVRVVAFPNELRERVNILLPVQEIAASDPHFTPSLRMVQLDVETHSYEQGRGKRALTKQGLEVLASGAGILRTVTKRIPRAELEEGEVGYEARVQIRRSDGSVEEIRREKIVSWPVEKFKIREQVEAAAGKWNWPAEKAAVELRKRELTEREWLHSKCESKAVLRALRAALQIPHTFTPEQLAKPFLVVGYAFTPNWDDPVIKRMLVEHGLAATTRVYGDDPGEPPAALDPAPESQRKLDRRVIAPAREPDEGDEPVGEARSVSPTDGTAAAPVEPPEHHEPTPNPPPPPPAARAPEQPSGWQPPRYPHGDPEPPPPEPVQQTLEGDPSASVRDAAGRVKVGFGRHKGKTLAEIDAEDNGYVAWLARSASDPEVKRAAEEWTNG